jgi:hypothetical protein
MLSNPDRWPVADTDAAKPSSGIRRDLLETNAGEIAFGQARKTEGFDPSII